MTSGWSNDGADSLERHRQRLALRTHVDSMMYLIHRREQLREDPNTFLSAQPAVPLRPVSGDGKPRNLER